VADPKGQSWTIRTASAEETEAVAGRLAAMLRSGDVVSLSGELGAGKTTFTRGLVRGLGSAASVSSPTFTLIHEYAGGRLPVYHVDAYRLSGAMDAHGTGLTDYLARGDGVVIVEWPENIPALLPEGRLDLTLSEEGEEARHIVFAPRGPRWEGFSGC
jgi:tRNA threonylcarbamoyladenosine biosynthesis protein TsaE